MSSKRELLNLDHFVCRAHCAQTPETTSYDDRTSIDEKVLYKLYSTIYHTTGDSRRGPLKFLHLTTMFVHSLSRIFPSNLLADEREVEEKEVSPSQAQTQKDEGPFQFVFVSLSPLFGANDNLPFRVNVCAKE